MPQLAQRPDKNAWLMAMDPVVLQTLSIEGKPPYPYVPPAKKVVTDQKIFKKQAPKSSYRERCMDQIRLILCTDDKKYADLRKKLAKNVGKSETFLVSAIASVIGAHFGVAAGLLVPTIAACLLFVLHVNLGAFCAGLPDIPTQKNTRSKASMPRTAKKNCSK